VSGLEADRELAARLAPGFFVKTRPLLPTPKYR
jgi:hypothetical protein